MQSPPRKRGRTTTGCIGCRLRRKKCGEETPHCANCERNGLLCTYPRGGSMLHSALLRRTNPTGRGGGPREQGGRGGRPGCPERPGQPEPEHPASPTPTPDVDVPDVPDDTPIPSLSSVFLPPLLLSRPPLRHHPQSHRVFHHYLHRTSRVLAVCQGTRNPFLGELVPLAMESDLVLHALVALSGVHCASQGGCGPGGGPGSPVDEATWLHYGQTLQGAKAGLTRLAGGDRTDVVPLLVTTLVLCSLETFRADADAGEHALQHLLAARALLPEALKLPATQLGPTLRGFLVERYIYSLILAHITMGRHTDQWVVHDTAVLFPVLGDSSNGGGGTPEVSCVHALFRLIPRVARVAHAWCDSEAGEAGEADRAALSAERDRLARRLAAWRPASDDEAHTVCGRLYQQALLVYLAAACGGEEASTTAVTTAPPTTDAVDDALDRFLPFLASIPLGSVTSTTLCWPLVVFGACARRPAHRAALAQRLDALSTAYAARSVRDARQLLETHWATAGGAHPPGFEATMRQANRTVLFL